MAYNPIFKDIIKRLEYICPELDHPKRKYPMTNNAYNWVVLNTLSKGKVKWMVESQGQ